MNTSSDKISRYGSANSKDRKDSARKYTNQDKEDETIQDKTQISVKKYYQGTHNYKIIIKVKMVSYESKLNTPFLSIESLDSKTIVLRNKPDIIKGNNKIQITRDVSNLQKDKVQMFDWVFGENENSEIMTVKFLQEPVNNLLKGYNQSIVLYGGADSGKTHLTIGNLRDPGLIILLIKEVLYHKSELEDKGIQTKISMSLSQYHNDQFYDCIVGHKFPLEVHEDSQKQLYIAGLYEVEVKSLLQAMRIIKVAQLHLQNYEQSTDKSKDLLKNTNIIFEIKCIQEDIKDIDKKLIISSLKLIKFERETFNDAINAGAQNSILAPYNNCLRIISEINLKTRKTNQIPYKANRLIEYIRDSIGGNSQTYLIGCANPLAQNLQDTESLIRYLNLGKSITTSPEQIKYSNKSQENYAEVYQKLIRENIQGWIQEFVGDQQNLTKQQQIRLTIIGNILNKIQQYFNKLLRIYTDVQDCQNQLQVIYHHIIDNMSKAYTKSITSSDVKEFYIGKLQQYNIDTFKVLLSNYSSSIEINLNKLYKQKMKAEVWEYKLVQHLKLKELREQRPEDLQPKDVEKLVTISKQSKKLYQFYNEQICQSQFDYVKSKELLNSLFIDINQIKQIQSFTQIPTLQQINSTQFVEIKNKNGSVSTKSIEDLGINYSTEGKSPLQKKNILQHQMSSFKLQKRAPSLFQQQRDDSLGESSYEYDEAQSPEINSARRKNQKSQFLIQNILANENDEQVRKNTISISNENFTQNSEKQITYEDNPKNDLPLNMKQLERKYLNQKKKYAEPTKFIYVNNTKIEVKKNSFKKPKRQNPDYQNSILQSSIIQGEGEQNSQDKYYEKESANYDKTHNQILSQDQSLISQLNQNNKTNELQGHNQSNIEGMDKFQSINQLLSANNDSNLFSHRASNQMPPISNSIIQNNIDQSYQVKSSIQSKNLSNSEEVSQRIQSYQLNLPYLSQLLDNQLNATNDYPSQDNTNTAKPNPMISLVPSNQISMIHSPLQHSQIYQNSLLQQEDTSRLKRIHQSGINDNTLLSLSPKLELDDGILSDIFQKSKFDTKTEFSQENRYQQMEKKIKQEYQFTKPRNIQTLSNSKSKQNSLGKSNERTLDSITASYSKIKFLQSPISNYNIVNKKLSLINLRGQHLYDKNLEGKDISYQRTQLKESNTPLPKDYFYELLHRSQQTGKNESKQTIKKGSGNSNFVKNLNQSINHNSHQEVATQNSSENIQSNIFQKYEHQPEFNPNQKATVPLKNIQHKSLEKSASQQQIKLPQQTQQQQVTRKQPQPILFIKDQMGLKLPNINETLLHRSKYTKFFLN